MLVPILAAALAAPALPSAVVGTHSVTIPGPPALTVTVPDAAHYAGGERFVLYGNADAELHLFVEAGADNRIRRLYWVQQEEYLPTLPDKRYTYGQKDRRATLWGETAWIASGFGKSDFKTREGSDREHVRVLLKRAGYRWPSAMMQVRPSVVTTENRVLISVARWKAASAMPSTGAAVSSRAASRPGSPKQAIT